MSTRTKILLYILIFLGSGIVYYLAEVVFRAAVGHKAAHPAIILVGGTVCLTVVMMYFSKAMNGGLRCVTAGLLCSAIEFAYGVLLNIILKLDMWSYSGNFSNLYGQISLKWSIIWFAATAAFFGIANFIRTGNVIRRDGKPTAAPENGN